jgi:hypothetical protein
LSEICKIQPTYESSLESASDSLGPDRMIVKCTPTGFEVRTIARLFRLFQTEVDFYRNDVPLQCGMSSGEMYYAAYDKKNARSCMIMEDLAPDKPPDQVQS